MPPDAGQCEMGLEQVYQSIQLWMDFVMFLESTKRVMAWDNKAQMGRN